MLLSFVVTAIPCLIIDKIIGENMESSLVIAVSLIIGAIVMLIVDYGFGKNPTTHTIESVTPKQAIAIGLFSNLGGCLSWDEPLDGYHHRVVNSSDLLDLSL